MSKYVSKLTTPQDVRDLFKSIEELLDSGDSSGCTEDLIVVSRQEYFKLQAAYEKFCTFFIGERPDLKPHPTYRRIDADGNVYLQDGRRVGQMDKEANTGRYPAGGWKLGRSHKEGSHIVRRETEEETD